MYNIGPSGERRLVEQREPVSFLDIMVHVCLDILHTSAVNPSTLSQLCDKFIDLFVCTC
jgi:hypothetical protein